MSGLFRRVRRKTKKDYPITHSAVSERRLTPQNIESVHIPRRKGCGGLGLGL